MLRNYRQNHKVRFLVIRIAEEVNSKRSQWLSERIYADNSLNIEIWDSKTVDTIFWKVWYKFKATWKHCHH